MLRRTTGIGCYVHIPFCVRKCAYCDFNSFSGYTDASIARYVHALPGNPPLASSRSSAAGWGP